MPARKTRYAALILLAISLGFSLILGEFALRVFLKEEINLFPRYHTSAQYGEFTIRRFRPNTVFWHTSLDGQWKFVINAQGFRNDRNFSYKKPPGILRILSLGDSHTAGFEVRQDRTFSAVIERHLQENGIRTEVINAGVSGFSTAEELVLLENEGVKYRPDAVVLGFYANDFEDNIKAGIFGLDHNEIIVRKTEHIPGVRILNVINEFSILRWLSENSYLYSFALNTVWNFAKRLLTTRAKAKLQTEYAVPTGKVNDYQLELTARLIERIYTVCRRNNIRFIILDIPRFSKQGKIRSSVPPTLVDTMRANSDQFIYSKEILHDYRDAGEFHVLHGARHISELTHRLYGVETARSLIKMINTSRPF